MYTYTYIYIYTHIRTIYNLNLMVNFCGEQVLSNIVSIDHRLPHCLLKGCK